MQIYQSISKVMSEIGAVTKAKKNTQQNFMYRGVDDVMNALQPALINNGIFVAPEVLEQTREERQSSKGSNLIYSVMRIKYTFYASDGSSVSVTVIGEGMDSGDKASNKAMSVAFKYACFQIFCIPTEEMKDPDADTPPESSRKAPPKRVEKTGKPFLEPSVDLDISFPGEEPPKCEACGGEIKPGKNSRGEIASPEEVAQARKDKYGRALCTKCVKEKHESAV